MYRLAHEIRLSGKVGNDSDGVFVEIEGDRTSLEEFQARLLSDLPPIAHISQVHSTEIAVTGDDGFVIESSKKGSGTHKIEITPDFTTCRDCLAEVDDPSDRRFRYPFINCTNCGPRYTIVRSVPYDRATTTMCEFPMCPACQKEYDNPLNRRFHAQPNACPDCGPQLTFLHSDGRVLGERDKAMSACAQRIVDGRLLR